MTDSEAEALLSEDFILRIIESEDITVEVQKETDEEITKVRFLYQTYILLFATSSCYAWTWQKNKQQKSIKQLSLNDKQLNELSK